MQCTYTSQPGVPRFAALKVEHDEMKASYDNLLRLHQRLRCGSAFEVSALIERIRLEDEVPDMPEDNCMIERPMEDPQPPVYVNGHQVNAKDLKLTWLLCRNEQVHRLRTTR